MSYTGNQYWNGSNGKIWVNDSEWDKVKSFELKMAIEFEDIPDGLSTERVLMGYAFEGSFSYRKSDNNYNKALDLLFEDYSNGTVPDVSIVGKAFNRTSGKTERIKITGITFDEIVLQQWEEKTLIEVEMPFKASKVERLQ